MGDLSETETIYTIANGEKVASQQILRDAEITIGDCSYTIDLVVTDNPLFDLLVGNNFLVQGEAEISLGSQTMTLTTEHFGQRTTQVLGLRVSSSHSQPQQDDTDSDESKEPMHQCHVIQTTDEPSRRRAPVQANYNFPSGLCPVQGSWTRLRETSNLSTAGLPNTVDAVNASPRTPGAAASRADRRSIAPPHTRVTRVYVPRHYRKSGVPENEQRVPSPGTLTPERQDDAPWDTTSPEPDVPTQSDKRHDQVANLETPGTTGADLVLAIDEQSKGEPSVDGEQGTVPERPQQPPPIN